MGSCFSSTNKTSSSSSSSPFPPSAKVITLDGYLSEYNAPVTAADALGYDQQSCFLCDVGSILFDSSIPNMTSDELLEPGHIYFVMPVDRLGRVLSGSEMAVLAVRAGSALRRCSNVFAEVGRVWSCSKGRLFTIEESDEH